MDSKRIGYIDFLKTVGLLLLILAHVDAPSFLLQFRCFDVPLMVILSGILAKKSYKRYQVRKTNNKFLGYLWKRIVRLLIPTYIFLTLFFLIMFILGSHYTIWDIVYSYLLQSGNRGIGYVWIILVYLLCAIMVPYLYRIKITSPWVIISLIFIYGIYELLIHYQIGMDNLFFYSVFYFAIPYGILTLIGLNYNELNQKQRFVIFLISALAFFMIMGFYIFKDRAIKNIALFKYPPRIYFLSYGLFMSMLLIHIMSKKNHKIYNNIIVRQVSKSTLWIYLWHIFFINIFDRLGLFETWWTRFIMLVVLSCGLTIVQNAILDLLVKKKKYKSWMSVFRG